MKNENMIEELNTIDIESVNGAGVRGYRIGFAIGDKVGLGHTGGKIGSAVEDFFFS